jgi:NAD(P)-dependent dehydrogenase (short-subunit alcohol dehydrogenase family)
MHQLFDIKDTVIAITGGGGVLGSSMAAYLSGEGARIALLDLRAELAEEKAAQLPGEAIGLAANVLEEASLEAAKAAVMDRFGRVDVLINAAGGNMPGATISADGTIFDLSIDAFRKVTDLNLTGSVLPSLAFGKVMAEQKSGVVINISSMTAMRTITRVVGYSAAKAAIDNFTRWLAVELADRKSVV